VESSNLHYSSIQP